MLRPFLVLCCILGPVLVIHCYILGPISCCLLGKVLSHPFPSSTFLFELCKKLLKLKFVSTEVISILIQ